MIKAMMMMMKSFQNKRIEIRNRKMMKLTLMKLQYIKFISRKLTLNEINVL